MNSLIQNSIAQAFSNKNNLSIPKDTHISYVKNFKGSTTTVLIESDLSFSSSLVVKNLWAKTLNKVNDTDIVFSLPKKYPHTATVVQQVFALWVSGEKAYLSVDIVD